MRARINRDVANRHIADAQLQRVEHGIAGFETATGQGDQRTAADPAPLRRNRIDFERWIDLQAAANLGFLPDAAAQYAQADVELAGLGNRRQLRGDDRAAVVIVVAVDAEDARLNFAGKQFERLGIVGNAEPGQGNHGRLVALHAARLYRVQRQLEQVLAAVTEVEPLVLAQAGRGGYWYRHRSA